MIRALSRPVAGHLLPRPPTTHSRMTQFALSHPSLFKRLTALLGYNTPKTHYNARMLTLYAHAVTPVSMRQYPFVTGALGLPRTFQTHFLITNLHIWLLTARLRALPTRAALQCLVDHFFIDLEDRLVALLRPSPNPVVYTTQTQFYPPRPVSSGRAPHTLVTRQLKIFRDQWQGISVALDHALVAGDPHMAAVLFRNYLLHDGHDKVQAIATLTNYIRRQLARLETLPDALFADAPLYEMCMRVGMWGTIAGETRSEKAHDAYLTRLYEVAKSPTEDGVQELQLLFARIYDETVDEPVEKIVEKPSVEEPVAPLVQTPVVKEPTPVVKKPTPVAKKAAPVVKKPSPVVKKAAPVAAPKPKRASKKSSTAAKK